MTQTTIEMIGLLQRITVNWIFMGIHNGWKNRFYGARSGNPKRIKVYENMSGEQNG